MDAKLSKEIDKIVAEMMPLVGSVALMTREDYERAISLAAERGAIAGWVHGMRTAANVAKQAMEEKPAWKGLTEAEINEWDYDTRDVVMDIEKLLREKNT
jgi:hypothetical protein